MSVTAALSALSFVSERTSGGERQNNDSRVDASDVDTDISSRLMYNIVYVFLFLCILIRTRLFACLMLGLPRCTHAPLHSREQACCEVTPNSLAFSLDKTLERGALEGNAPRSSWGESVSADLRVQIQRCHMAVGEE